MKKIILRIIIIILISYFIFLAEESIRLYNNSKSIPLVVLDKKLCSKDSIVCYDYKNEYEEEYLSLGFKLKKVYYLDSKSSQDNLMYYLVKEEFYLLNKFMLWGWIS